MEKVKSQSSVQVKVLLQLEEEEARALNELVGYGEDAFLKVFYENLGQHYLKPHEAGLRSLFKTIAKELPPHLRRADKAREAFKS